MTHIFLTGQPGVGKTTLVRQVLSQLQQQHPALNPPGLARGFYTEEVRGQGGRVGFDIVTLDHQRAPLARVGTLPQGAAAVGKYVVNVPSFESLALPALQLQPDTRLYVIDEVGKMELFSHAFYPAVEALLNTSAIVYGTMPTAKYGRHIPEVELIKARPDVEIITVTRQNRDSLVTVLTSRLHQALAC
eukprot:jgi/Chrzof1/6540/Cz19g00120.t1